jgi:hypothetical protein
MITCVNLIAVNQFKVNSFLLAIADQSFVLQNQPSPLAISNMYKSIHLFDVNY